MNLYPWENDRILNLGRLALDKNTSPELRAQVIDEIRSIQATAEARAEESIVAMVEETFTTENGRTLYTLKPAPETVQPSTTEGE